jgi:hypothetical protein
MLDRKRYINVKLVTLAEEGPTGGFFDENEVAPW